MIRVILYFAGLAIFGFIYWILDAILDVFIGANVATLGAVYNLCIFLWGAVLVVYLIFGGLYFVRQFMEKKPGGI